MAWAFLQFRRTLKRRFEGKGGHFSGSGALNLLFFRNLLPQPSPATFSSHMPLFFFSTTSSPLPSLSVITSLNLYLVSSPQFCFCSQHSSQRSTAVIHFGSSFKFSLSNYMLRICFSSLTTSSPAALTRSHQYLYSLSLYHITPIFAKFTLFTLQRTASVPLSGFLHQLVSCLRPFL